MRALRERQRLPAYAALTLAGIFWGLGFVFGKFALADMPVPVMVTYRFAVASIALLPVALWRRNSASVRDLIVFSVAGFLYVPVQFLVQFEGLARTSVTHASLMVALVPVLLAITSSLLGNSSSGRPRWPAIGASAFGAVLVVAGPGGSSSLFGDTLVLLSLFAGIGWILMSERFMQRHDAIGSSVLVLLLGTGMLIVLESIIHPRQLLHPYSASAWLATIGSGVFSTALATVLWNVGLRSVPSSDAGVFINLEPLVGSICGVLLFGDLLGWRLIVGGCLIIAGAIAVARLSAQPASGCPSRNAA
jgi:drug/metabolite transporter (DMT)-like permease